MSGPFSEEFFFNAWIEQLCCTGYSQRMSCFRWNSNLAHVWQDSIQRINSEVVNTSVFSCLETLMKHSPSFMKYYITAHVMLWVTSVTQYVSLTSRLFRSTGFVSRIAEQKSTSMTCLTVLSINLLSLNFQIHGHFCLRISYSWPLWEWLISLFLVRRQTCFKRFDDEVMICYDM